MNKLQFRALLVASALASMGLAAACGGGDSDIIEVDQAEVDRFRAALPEAENLSATRPESGSPGALTQSLVGAPALYPRAAAPVVVGVNGSVAAMIALLKTITVIPPTFYDKENGDMVWGPYDNDNGRGQVAVLIHDDGPDTTEDFRYTYAFFRMVDNDFDNAVPVIWGGAQPHPDNEDWGTGLTLWDFEADYAFSQSMNEDLEDRDRGRFLALYGKGPDEDKSENINTIVLASFAGFVPKDQPDAQPLTVDYLYGRVVEPENTVDFLNYAGQWDVDDGDGDPNTSAASDPEDLDVRMVFLNSGIGRAEAGASGGDFESSPEVAGIEAVECWDESVSQTYLSYTAYDDAGTEVASSSLGDGDSCGPIFSKTIEELEIPTLDDVDPELLQVLRDITANGPPTM